MSFRDVSIGCMCLTFGSCALWLTLRMDAVLTNVDNGVIEAREQMANAAMAVNQPKWGTIAMLNSDLLQARLTLDATNKVIIHEQAQLGSIDALAAQLGRDLHGVSVSASTAATAATETAHSASRALDTANVTIGAAQPVLGQMALSAQAFTMATDSLNVRIRDPKIDELMEHLRGMSESGDGILADGRKVADKATHDFITPQPWYRRLQHYAGDGFDFGALLARHIP